MNLLDLNKINLVPCHFLYKNGKWENSVNKEKLILRNPLKSKCVYGFYNEKSEFIPFDYGETHWLYIFQLTLFANSKTDIHYFRHLFAALLTPSKFFIPESFQSALKKLFNAQMECKEWMINEIYKCTILCSQKKQCLIIPILNTFGYAFKVVQASIIKEAYSTMFSVSKDKRFEDYTNTAIFGHFDLLANSIRKLNHKINTDNELLQILFWINDLQENIPHINIIERYFYYFSPKVQWEIICKLFYEHKQGEYRFQQYHIRTTD